MIKIKSFENFSIISESWINSLSDYDWIKKFKDIQGLSTVISDPKDKKVRAISWKKSSGSAVTFKAVMKQDGSGGEIKLHLSTPEEKFKGTIGSVRAEMMKNLQSVATVEPGLKQAKSKDGKAVWYNVISFKETEASKVFNELDKAIKKYPNLTK